MAAFECVGEYKSVEMIGYFLTVFFAFLAFEYAYYIIAKRLRIVDRPHHQSSHRGVVVRGGGIVFYMAYAIWSISNGFSWYGALIGLTILAVISFVDDIHSISPIVRLICQFIAILMLFSLVMSKFAKLHLFAKKIRRCGDGF